MRRGRKVIRTRYRNENIETSSEDELPLKKGKIFNSEIFKTEKYNVTPEKPKILISPIIDEEAHPNMKVNLLAKRETLDKLIKEGILKEWRDNPILKQFKIAPTIRQYAKLRKKQPKKYSPIDIYVFRYQAPGVGYSGQILTQSEFEHTFKYKEQVIEDPKIQKKKPKLKLKPKKKKEIKRRVKDESTIYEPCEDNESDIEWKNSGLYRIIFIGKENKDHLARNFSDIEINEEEKAENVKINKIEDSENDIRNIKSLESKERFKEALKAKGNDPNGIGNDQSTYQPINYNEFLYQPPIFQFGGLNDNSYPNLNINHLNFVNQIKTEYPGPHINQFYEQNTVLQEDFCEIEDINNNEANDAQKNIENTIHENIIVDEIESSDINKNSNDYYHKKNSDESNGEMSEYIEKNNPDTESESQ